MKFTGMLYYRLEFGTWLNETVSVLYKHMKVLYVEYVLAFVGLLFLL